MLILIYMNVVSITNKDMIKDLCRIKKKEQSIEEKEIGRDIELTSYAKEIGLLLRTPSYDEFDTHSVVDIEGDIEQFENLHSDHLWIVITKRDEIKEIDVQDFNYYLPVEDGMFSEKMTLQDRKSVV